MNLARPRRTSGGKRGNRSQDQEIVDQAQWGRAHSETDDICCTTSNLPSSTAWKHQQHISLCVMLQKERPEGITTRRTSIVPTAEHVLDGRSRTPLGHNDSSSPKTFTTRTRRLLLCSSSFRDVGASPTNSVTMFVNQHDSRPRDVGEPLLTLVSLFPSSKKRCTHANVHTSMCLT